MIEVHPNVTMTITDDADIEVDDFILGTGAKLAVDGRANITIEAAGQFSMASGSEISRAADHVAGPETVSISADTATLASGALIDVTGGGHKNVIFSHGEGPGGGTVVYTTLGGRHGGSDGYGDEQQPTEWGSAGGPLAAFVPNYDGPNPDGGNKDGTFGTAGDGGRAIRLDVSGTLSLDGELRADGDSPAYEKCQFDPVTDGFAGAGSGGSV